MYFILNMGEKMDNIEEKILQVAFRIKELDAYLERQHDMMEGLEDSHADFSYDLIEQLGFTHKTKALNYLSLIHI